MLTKRREGVVEAIARRLRAAHPLDLDHLADIDFDNACIPNAPRPALAGQPLYCAPEVLQGGEPASIVSDRFALSTVLHEVVLHRHPLVGLLPADPSFDQYLAALGQVRWVEDPREATAAATKPDPPIEMLPREVHALFCRALTIDPSSRPSAAEWAEAWRRAAHRLFACHVCGRAFVNEVESFTCPHCGASASVPSLRVNGRIIRLAAMTTTVGRDDIGADETVSREHVAFRRRGHALELVCRGKNGVAIYSGNQWVVLAKGDSMEVGAGDVVRFAPQVEGMIEEMGSATGASVSGARRGAA